MSSKAWNVRPEPFHEQPNLTAKSVLRSATTLLAASGVCIVIAGNATSLINDTLQPYAIIVSYIAAAMLGIIALQGYLYLPEAKQRPPWKTDLNEAQKKLYGITTPPGAMKAAAGVGKEAATPMGLLGAPLRNVQKSPALTPVTYQEVSPMQRVPSPGSRSAGKRSPYDADKSMTPEHLKKVLDEFEIGAQQAIEGPVAGDYIYSLGRGPSPSLIGTTPPPYRPSAQAKGIATTMARADGKLEPSSPDSEKGALQRLDLTQRTLMGGIENLREWMAEQVLHPLITAIDTAHSGVTTTASALGWSSLILSPLDSSVSGNGAHNTARADDELQVSGLKGQIMDRLRSMGGGLHYSCPSEVSACLEAINTYQGISALLKGEFPSGLLVATPNGYILSRLRRLADGPVVKAFEWSSGGEWMGKAWTPDDLPTDSSLLFYIFSAYLAAPKWIFPSHLGSSSLPDGVQGLLGAVPLYVGKAPPRVAGEYTALVAARPPPSHKATAVVGLQLGTRQPHFCLLVSGDVLLTLSGPHALWEALTCFVRNAELSGGAIGGRTLDYLGLVDLIKAPSVSVFARMNLGRLMHMW
jgi:Cytochrome B561, N terminal